MKKRILILALAALVSFGGIATAQDLGLTLGAEFGINNLSEFDEGMSLNFFFEYENNALVDNLDFMAGVAVPIAPLGTDDDVGVEFELYADALYRMDLDGGMVFGFGLELDIFSSNLTGDADLVINFGFTPKARFEMEMAGLGDFYAQLELPIFGINTDDTELGMGLNLWAGLFMDMGFGIEAGLAGPSFGETGGFIPSAGMDFGLGDGNEFSMGWFALKPSYTYEFLYAELGVYIGLFEKAMDITGIIMIPRVEVDFTTIAVPGLTAWLELPISGLGADGDNSIGLTIGASYSF